MKFDAWLHEMEGYSSRFERLLDDFPEEKNVHRLLTWLRAAHEVGIREGAKSQDKEYEV